MKKLVFNLKDFNGLAGCYDVNQVAAETAQAKFDEWFVREIMSAPVVYSNNAHAWLESENTISLKKARIVMIEEIKKECKHEPDSFESYVNTGKYSCKHCGVRLIQEWKEVKP